MAFLKSPTSPFLLGLDPPALCSKSPGEVGGLGETISGTSDEMPGGHFVNTKGRRCILAKFDR